MEFFQNLPPIQRYYQAKTTYVYALDDHSHIFATPATLFYSFAI